ncbi:hypothetical protein ACA910_008266 [Epithemia clementina (nom. ined.)]
MRRAIVKLLTALVKTAGALGQYVCRFIPQTAASCPTNESKRRIASLQTSNAKRQRVDERTNSDEGDPREERTNKNNWAYLSRIRMADFSLSHYDFDSTAEEKAVKNDKAEVPIQLWDFRIAFLLGVEELSLTQIRAIELLRRAVLQKWKRDLVLSWGMKWWRHHKDHLHQYNSSEATLIWSRGVAACDCALSATI